MLKTKKDILDFIKPLISAETDLDLYILYGSAVSDKLTQYSDIDLAIGLRKGLSIII